VNLFGCFAQFETAFRKERQLEGISKAKAEGVYKGRHPCRSIGPFPRLSRRWKCSRTRVRWSDQPVHHRR
jgi:DNA invertase Pin-like site-specific DNA recombinase